MRRILRAFRTRLIVRLDQFVSWPPSIQVPILILLTIALIAVWAFAWSLASGYSLRHTAWLALIHFMDGGTMAGDTNHIDKIVATGVTATGVLVLSFLTGAFASKLGERLDELRSGRSAVLENRHILILGWDSKVPLMIRELARSHQRVRVVLLSMEEKARVDAVLRVARQERGSRIRVIARTGDPRSELALLRVCADRARSIVVISPAKLDDDHAMRWSVSTLLAVRRAVGADFNGRLVVESRRAIHASLLKLTCEPEVAGAGAIPIDVFAADDIVARVIAQSIRQSGVYFALRELLSFRGSELYVEPIPPSLVGKTFEHAHDLVVHGIATGVYRANGSYELAPRHSDHRLLKADDRLIILEEDRRTFTLGQSLPHAKIPAPPQPLSMLEPQHILVIGNNRTLPRLVTEMNNILPSGSRVGVSCPALKAAEDAALANAGKSAPNLSVERETLDPAGDLLDEEKMLTGVDGVVILGCEDEDDPDGDASALSILLRFRYARREHGPRIKKLITEVRDPAAANQVAGSLDDFLVSTDVVAMVLTHAALEPRLIAAHRELLDPSGVEVFLVPRSVYAPEGQRATFGEIMAAARLRDEIAIGFLPHRRESSALSAGARIEAGRVEVDEASPVYLNPPRGEHLPEGPGVMIVVLADPPEERSWV